MSANIETMFYVREKPWHGLGTEVKEAPTSADALIYAGLDWTVEQKNVYAEDGTLKAATVIKGEQICKKPKTKMSTRTVTIPHELTLRIMTLKQSREQLKTDLGDFWQGGDWVFVQDNGQMMNYSTPYQALQDVLHRYNADKAPEEQLPVIPFHGLRHTAATLLIAAGVDVKTISARLGHALTSTTMNIYVHALQESDEKAADAISNLLGKQS